MIAKIIDDVPVFSSKDNHKAPVILSLYKAGVGFRPQAIPFVEFTKLIDRMASEGFIYDHGKESEMILIAEVYLLGKTIGEMDGIERRLLEAHRWDMIKHGEFTCLSPKAYKAI